MNPDGNRRTPYADDILNTLAQASLDVSVARIDRSMNRNETQAEFERRIADPELDFGDEMAQYLADRGIYLTLRDPLGGS